MGIQVGGWVGYTGYLPSQLLEEQTPSEAGPGSPTGAGVGGVCSGRTGDGGGNGSWDHLLRRPGRCPLGPSLSQDPQNAASWPKRARFDLISLKVS